MRQRKKYDAIRRVQECHIFPVQHCVAVKVVAGKPKLQELDQSSEVLGGDSCIKATQQYDTVSVQPFFVGFTF